MNTPKEKGALQSAQIKTTYAANNSTTLYQVEQALAFIDASDRDTWIRCGMAAKSEFGDAAFDVWDRWSSMADNYRARDAAIRWKSFKASGGITIATLFKLAIDNGYRHNTTDKPTPPTPEEIAQREARSRAEADTLAKRRTVAATKAQAIWNEPASALEATQPSVKEHPYIKRKGIMPHGLKVFHGSLSIGGMDCNGALMMPMQLGGIITSLQFINREGEKRFLPDGEKGGYLIGKIEAGKPVCICEGLATGASIHEATDYPVIVAFDAGNLRKMAEAFKAKRPDAEIILCADDDATGTGQRKANEAARLVGGLVAMPVFGDGRKDNETDFNDMAESLGLDAVKLAIESAQQVQEVADPLGSDLSRLSCGSEVKVSPQSHSPLPVVQITCAADIKPVSVNWLWDGWLARGKMHIFAGQAGTGKTTIALALAATVSNGGRFPDGSRCPVGDVLIWSGEDSPEDTLVPRLMASGADMQRVHFVGDVRHGDAIRSFDPATDIQALTDAAVCIGDVSMLIVDPVVSAVQGDSHKNGEVRRALQPLVDFGERLGCAVLGISHFSKGTGGKDPLERVSGSLAFGALARIVLATAKTTTEESTRRIFCRAKSNIGPDSGGYEYDLNQVELTDCKGLFASYAAWGNAVEGTARELLAVEQDETEGGDSLSDAREFLSSILGDGPLPVKAIKADADGAGYSWATIRRAQKSLGVEAEKEGFGKGGGWVWKLPNLLRCSENIKGAQQNSVSILGKSEHLKEKSTENGDQLTEVWEV